MFRAMSVLHIQSTVTGIDIGQQELSACTGN